MQTSGRGYYSSHEKDLIRDHFDLPLLRSFRDRKGDSLSYFGLPGAEALDIEAWIDVIGQVAAVERNPDDLERLEQLFETRHPEVRCQTHFGEMDEVILKNRGRRRDIGGEYYRPWVGNSFEASVEGYVWQFDVVYLDYFGPFLPKGKLKGFGAARRRADALRRLFAKDRLDAWQPWILLVTVEAGLAGKKMKSLLRHYLVNAKDDYAREIREAIDYLLSTAQIPQEETVRLIHGTAAILLSAASSNGNVVAQPRGTVLYKGANDRPMAHLAFEFTPTNAILGGSSQLLSLLLAPILKPRDTDTSPWFEPLQSQSSGTTRATSRQCLDFLESSDLNAILDRLPAERAS